MVPRECLHGDWRNQITKRKTYKQKITITIGHNNIITNTRVRCYAWVSRLHDYAVARDVTPWPRMRGEKLLTRSSSSQISAKQFCLPMILLQQSINTDFTGISPCVAVDTYRAVGDGEPRAETLLTGSIGQRHDSRVLQNLRIGSP